MSIAKRHVTMAVVLLGEQPRVLVSTPSDGYDVAIMPANAPNMSPYIVSRVGKVTSADVVYDPGSAGKVSVIAVRARKANRMVSEVAAVQIPVITDSGGSVVRRPESPFDLRALLTDGGAVVSWRCNDVGGSDDARLDGFLVYYGLEGEGASGYVEVSDPFARSVALTSSHLQAGHRNWVNVQAVGVHGCADGNNRRIWVSPQSVQPDSLASANLVAAVEA